jgi:hypothetical protein
MIIKRQIIDLHHSVLLLFTWMPDKLAQAQRCALKGSETTAASAGLPGIDQNETAFFAAEFFDACRLRRGR